MKTHIEYDDFGEYVESMEDLGHIEKKEKPKKEEKLA